MQGEEAEGEGLPCRSTAASRVQAPCSSLGGLAGPGAASGRSPLLALAASSHLPATRLHLSFCLADVFLKQLDVSELDRSALLRI